MMKEEFEKILGKTVSDADYELIEYVYARHPAIDDVHGKKQIADIYNMPGGMMIILDMIPTAKKMGDLQDEMVAHLNEIDRIKSEINDLKEGRNVHK